jgi:hypothetical protein
MSAVARMAMLDLRTVAPYRYQSFVVFAVCLVVLGNGRPIVIVPTLVLLLTSLVAAYPFVVGDKARLQTLYAVLPVPRRAVLLGHYAWAMACFATTVVVGTALSLVVGWVRSLPFDGDAFVTVLTLSWAIFVINVAVQFPLFIRFGYSRISVLCTFLPLALILVAVSRLHLVITSFASLQVWLPVIWAGGAAAIVASTAVAAIADRRRMLSGKS